MRDGQKGKREKNESNKTKSHRSILSKANKKVAVCKCEGEKDQNNECVGTGK